MACHSDNNNKKSNKNTLSAVFFWFFIQTLQCNDDITAIIQYKFQIETDRKRLSIKKYTISSNSKIFRQFYLPRVSF